MSTSAPFATAQSAIAQDEHVGGKKKFDGNSQQQAAPFATEYPEAREGTPGKKSGGKRLFDNKTDAPPPFATVDGPMFSPQEPAASPPAASNSTPAAGQTGRQKAFKPTDNRDVFKYDGSSPAGNDNPARSGKKRFDRNSNNDAPFATFGGEDTRNGTSCTDGGSADTPRSAGGRRKFEDKLQKKPAPFALDDGESDEESGKTVRAKASAPPYANDY